MLTPVIGKGKIAMWAGEHILTFGTLQVGREAPAIIEDEDLTLLF
jgi:hypothetical protein